MILTSMTAAANLQSRPSMAARPIEHVSNLSSERLVGQRFFKKHKNLPHPTRQQSEGRSVPNDARAAPRRSDLIVEPGATQRHVSQPAKSSSLQKHQTRRVRSGPALPPTPPAVSRASSESRSVQPSTPTCVETPSSSQDDVQIQVEQPATPLNQNSPPTPDVTPPQPLGRHEALRPVYGDRSVSKATTSDSRTESFRTAREEPYNSEEDDAKSTVRPSLPSARTSRNTVLRVSDVRSQEPEPIGLGLGLRHHAKESLTPTTRGEFILFDGEWASSSEVEQEWDENLGRNVMVRKRRGNSGFPETPRASDQAIVEDRRVAPSKATQAVRSMPLQDRDATWPSPKALPNGGHVRAQPSVSDASVASDRRRNSGVSSRSNVSTVVEAILVDTSPSPPRPQTLRHVRKRGALRDSMSDLSPSSSAPSSRARLPETERQRPPSKAQLSERRQESYASNRSVNSISSGRARREVWKNGGIPVIVVPDRRSSVKPQSHTPSLRSASSRRTQRSMSLSSATRTHRSQSNEPPIFDRPTRSGRTLSESDGSERTMDYPPTIPARSSSLSAPTSRNTSRAGSLTAESLHSRNALCNQDSHAGKALARRPRQASPSEPEMEEDDTIHRDLAHGLDADHHGDPLFGKRLSSQNTPFSIGSVETNGTAHEVSEAMAVNIYPHQNSSVLMVNHSSKPSESLNDLRKKHHEYATLESPEEPPEITTTAPDDGIPVTPPQLQFVVDDVDSPLRNPRAPPVPPDPADPPAINFIPATPSGTTPLDEKQQMLGNYFEAADEEPAERSMSLVRRALSGGRRHSVSYPPNATRPGFLKRTLSLSRGGRRRSITSEENERIPPDDLPVEENKLHPLWRPAYAEDDDELDRDLEDYDDDGDYRYGPIDRRPHRPKRSLSSRMKTTFAIFPVQDDDDMHWGSSRRETERRVIGRSPSGNLRVMRRRSSLDSLHDGRPSTAPKSDVRKKPPSSSLYWRDRPQNETDQPRRRRRFSLSDTMEELHGLSGRLSEKRREKRSQELRQKISGPREVRDGVGDIIRRGT